MVGNLTFSKLRVHTDRERPLHQLSSDSLPGIPETNCSRLVSTARCEQAGNAGTPERVPTCISPRGLLKFSRPFFSDAKNHAARLLSFSLPHSECSTGKLSANTIPEYGTINVLPHLLTYFQPIPLPESRCQQRALRNCLFEYPGCHTRCHHGLKIAKRAMDSSRRPLQNGHPPAMHPYGDRCRRWRDTHLANEKRRQLSGGR